jgi:hypothetical protein
MYLSSDGTAQPRRIARRKPRSGARDQYLSSMFASAFQLALGIIPHMKTTRRKVLLLPVAIVLLLSAKTVTKTVCFKNSLAFICIRIYRASS